MDVSLELLMNLRLRYWIAALIVLGFTLLSPLDSRAQMKARVAWTSFASNMSGTWVAQEEGLFKKYGLEVELVHIPSTSRAIQVMLAGELHYSYMDGRNSVTAALKGAPTWSFLPAWPIA